MPPTDRRFYPIYAECCELGVPFCCTQIGHTGPLMPSEVRRPIYLDQVAIDFPELVIVGGHIGYPGLLRGDCRRHQAQERLHRYLGVHRGAYPAALVEYLRGHGRKKVLFGSNYPMISPKKR